jgi:predicted ribonuclease YlaK
VTKVSLNDLINVEAKSQHQSDTIHQWNKNKNLILSGSAGTGKTFLAMYLALKEVLDKDTQYDKVVIVRSIVPTRNIGFLPGTEEEKKDVYSRPYISLCEELLGDRESWLDLSLSRRVEFVSTSFIRGTTLHNAIVIVDEMQNLNFHELDTVITRIGDNCRLVMCGDYYQSDFDKKLERDGIKDFMSIVREMDMFSVVEFTWEDIVRSELVKNYIMTKEKLKKRGQI